VRISRNQQSAGCQPSTDTRGRPPMVVTRSSDDPCETLTKARVVAVEYRLRRQHLIRRASVSDPGGPASTQPTRGGVALAPGYFCCDSARLAVFT
jgi:hypothetical protein